MKSMIECLREKTKVSHQRVEKLDFFKKLSNGTLRVDSLYTYYHCLHLITTALEFELKRSADDQIQGMMNLITLKTPLLQHDIELFGAYPRPVDATALNKTTSYVNKFSEFDLLQPYYKIGILYVLEGSQNGGIVLKSQVAKLLNIEVKSIQYFGAYGDRTRSFWQSFVACLNDFALSESQKLQMVEGAVATFQIMDTILSKLEADSTNELSYHAGALNPEAGSHLVTQDPAEIKLAVDAGVMAWKRFPYLQLRFADRGKKFTTSDSCWLLTQYPLSYEIIYKNILWLRNVLSARGIPSFILENHMDEILKGLLKLKPQCQSQFENFEKVIIELRRQRAAIFDQSLWLQIIEKCPGVESDNALGGAAEILLSAWADEKNGIPGSYRAVKDWYLSSLDKGATRQDLLVILKNIECANL